MGALNTQDETVRKLLYEKGADYIVSLKDNQPTLATTAQTLLPQDVPPSQGVTLEDNRSRWERRAIATRSVTPEQLGLAGAQLDKAVPAALVRALNKVAKGPGLYTPVRFPDSILSDQTKEFRDQNPTPKGSKLARFNRLLLRDAYPKEIDTEPKPEIDWLATSRAPGQMGAEAFLAKNRQYWGIENGTHQRLDCSALEDRLRLHEPNAVEILGFFHRVSISLFVAWADKQPKPRDRTYPTWQADHQANRWIMVHQVTKAPT